MAASQRTSGNRSGRRKAGVHRVKVSRWGHSLAIRIPADAAKTLNIHEGSLMTLEADDARMTVEPAEQQPTLEDLLEGVTPEKVGGEMDWGGPAGKEMW